MGRIAPPKGLEDDLEKLVSVDPQGKHPLFETKQKALMFAAALGHWRAGARRTVDKKGIGIRYDIFERALDDGYIDALAISVSDGDLKILAPERDDERIDIFEQSVQAGLEEMIDRFNRPGDPLESLLALVDEARAEPSAGLDGMDLDALRKLMGD